MSVVPPAVTTRVRADLTCAGVAAASVLAKCERDAIMVELAQQHPEYGWALNKGYSAPDHIEALRRLGPTPLHRRSWNLPGTEGAPAAGRRAVVHSFRLTPFRIAAVPRRVGPGGGQRWGIDRSSVGTARRQRPGT